MLHIDGAHGEGGGQILRTALALSLCLNRPVHISNIRIKRRKPGLAWQHLAAVQAATRVGRAEVEGAAHRSTELRFIPHGIHAGELLFDIGTAGSTSLVLQTILPALMLAKQASTVELIGGTHNPLSPSFDFLQRAFFPLMEKIGVSIQAELLRPGFFPHGGGHLKVHIQPAKKLRPLQLQHRGDILQKTAIARVAGLPLHIAERELHTLQKHLQLHNEDLHIEPLSSEYGPGNVVFVEIKTAQLSEVFTGYGERHLRAEVLAERLATEVKHYLNAEVPVGQHLADQLLLPLALAGGSFVTQQLSSHARTNMHVIRQFMPVEFDVQQLNAKAWRVTVNK